jgi:hypothetical protein
MKTYWPMFLLLACNIFWAGVVLYQASVILQQKEVIQFLVHHAVGFRP